MRSKSVLVTIKMNESGRLVADRAAPAGNAVKDILPEKLGFPGKPECVKSQIPLSARLKTIQSERNLAHGSKQTIKEVSTTS